MSALSVTAALPHVHPIADYEAAFNARRREIATVVIVSELTVRATFATRVRSLLARLNPLRSAPVAYVPPWVPCQPRDGRGRFLPNAWRRQAETLTESDLSWFRGPIR